MDLSTFWQPRKTPAAVETPRALPAQMPQQTLSREAVRLLIALKLAPSLRALPVEFPHVLNRLAALWPDAAKTGRYFDDLLMPSRDRRHGFPLPVLTELTMLRNRHRARVPPAATDPWSMMDRVR